MPSVRVTLDHLCLTFLGTVTQSYSCNLALTDEFWSKKGKSKYTRDGITEVRLGPTESSFLLVVVFFTSFKGLQVLKGLGSRVSGS